MTNDKKQHSSGVLIFIAIFLGPFYWAHSQAGWLGVFGLISGLVAVFRLWVWVMHHIKKPATNQQATSQEQWAAKPHPSDDGQITGETWQARVERLERKDEQVFLQDRATTRAHGVHTSMKTVSEPSPTPTPLELGNHYTIRDGKTIAVDAVFDAWVSDDLDAMVAVINKPTRPIDRHHLLNGIVSGAYKRRDEPYYAALCASTAETYLTEMPKLLRAISKDHKDMPLPHVPVFEKYATLLTEQKHFDRAIQVCRLAIDKKLHDSTQSGYEGRVFRIEKLQAKANALATATPMSKPEPKKTVHPPDQHKPTSAEPAPAHAWQVTIGEGAAELDRLVMMGDWDSARAALQCTAYGMLDAPPDEKRQFTQAMCKFAARDPLYYAVMQVVTPLVEATPGLTQTKLYPHLPNLTPETIRYVIYYAAEMGEVVRRKKGNSYAIFPKSYTLNSVP
jgi:hypothetical protein